MRAMRTQPLSTDRELVAPVRRGWLARVFGAVPVAPAEVADDVHGARLHALLEIARRLTETLDRREIFRLIVDETNRALRADGTVIRLLHGDDLALTAWAGLSDATASRMPRFRRDEG
jgi:hypothetical protein